MSSLGSTYNPSAANNSTNSPDIPLDICYPPSRVHNPVDNRFLVTQTSPKISRLDSPDSANEVS